VSWPPATNCILSGMISDFITLGLPEFGSLPTIVVG
jgi:hypothetical protein